MGRLLQMVFLGLESACFNRCQVRDLCLNLKQFFYIFSLPKFGSKPDIGSLTALAFLEQIPEANVAEGYPCAKKETSRELNTEIALYAADFVACRQWWADG